MRRDLCLGCGLCVEGCLQHAISIISATAQINQDRCNRCCLCIDVCPRGAIVETTPVSKHELQTTIASLKGKAEDIIARIDRMKM